MVIGGLEAHEVEGLFCFVLFPSSAQVPMQCLDPGNGFFRAYYPFFPICKITHHTFLFEEESIPHSGSQPHRDLG